MVTIVYGVSGEGAGHSSRAREVVPHLLNGGHRVHLVSYDRGHQVLAPLFGCIRVAGLHIVCRDNRVRPVRTLLANLRRLPALLRGMGCVLGLMRGVRPDVVITDFEPVTAWLARLRGIPLISLDNQHRMRYMQVDVPPELTRDWHLARRITRCMIPSPDAALATTFFRASVTNARTFLFPPIVRRAVRCLQPVRGQHHLVYLTNHFESLLAVLRRMPDQRFAVYGVDRAGREGNLHFYPFSEDRFLRHLESARSVIGTAGFTLTSEALYLGKPLLAFPMQGQFEQQLNALFVERAGYGVRASRGDESTVRRFLQRLPEFDAVLAEYPGGHARCSDGESLNSRLFSRLDWLLTDNGAPLRALRRERRVVRSKSGGSRAVID